MHYAKPVEGIVRPIWLDEVAENGDEPAPGYPCLIAGYWNGWAEPLFDKETTLRVIADQEKMRSELDESSRADVQRLAFDEAADQVVVTFAEGTDEEEEDRIDPVDADGKDRWNLGLGWTWEGKVDGFDPMAPTDEQKGAVKELKARLGQGEGTSPLAVSWHSRLALPDGTHVFSISADLGETNTYGEGEDAREIRVIRQVGGIKVAPDGSVAPANP
jgi:hypothetical protein